jgi:gluconolactonase
MHHPFQQTELIKAEVLTALPGRFRKKGRNAWTAANRDGSRSNVFSKALRPIATEMDTEDGLRVCHSGVGVYRFDNRMLPTDLIYSDNSEHLNLANIAFADADRRTLHIMQAMTGEILLVRLPVPGKKLYADQ